MTTFAGDRTSGYQPYRPPAPPPASIWLRLCAGAVDFSLVVGLAVALNAAFPWQTSGVSVGIADVVMALIEVVTGTSPGKLVVGLEIVWSGESLLRRVGRSAVKYLLAGLSFLPAFFKRQRRGLHDLVGGSIVCKRPASARVLRAVATVAACLYFAGTFGCGRLIGRLVDDRIDAARVDTVPTPLDPARGVEPPSDWVEVWHEDLRVRLPRRHEGAPLQNASFGVVIGGGRAKSLAGPRLIALFGDDNHPFRQCSAPGRAWRHILTCTDPQSAQRNALGIGLADRRYLTPYGMAVTNMRLVLKQQYVKGSPGRFFLRSYESGGLLVDWIGLQHVSDEPGSVATAYDDVFFATDTGRAGLTVMWTLTDSDDALLETMVRSAVLRPPTPAEVEAQLASSERSGDCLGALNVMRAGRHDRRVVETATACLVRIGLPWERERYAEWLQRLAEQDATLREPAERVRAWLPPSKGKS